MKTLIANSPITITTLHPEYLERVVEIEKCNSMESNPLGGAWSQKDFKDVLACPTRSGIVAWQDGKIVGFAVYTATKDKIHIANLAVHADYVNRGIGSMLIGKLKNKMKPKRRNTLEIDVRETNLHACNFLKKHGFKAFDVCRNWYEQPRSEDAYKFRYTLADE